MGTAALFLALAVFLGLALSIDSDEDPIVPPESM